MLDRLSANRFLLPCVGGLLLFCLCLGSLLVVSAIIFREEIISFVTPATPIAQPEKTAASERATPTTDQADPMETASVPDADLPADVAATMDEIQKQVVGLRGLQPNAPIMRALMSPDQLRERVINDFFDDYTDEEAQNDAIVLAVLGLLEPDFDLHNFYIDLLSEQVAGFYDHETKEMYVVQGEGFGGLERLTYSHEFTHILQDQAYDIEKGLNYNDEACETDTERCAAIQALIEGDASILEFQWFGKYATAEDQRQLMEFYGSYESPVFDSAPDFMKEDFLFPYQEGMAFAQYLYDQSGWETVDGAYRDLPVSTEQILHPERYPDDRPISVTLPDLGAILDDGWVEIERNVMGEWYTILILAHGLDVSTRLEETEAQAAAEGWGGDQYVVYFSEQTQATAMVFTTLWEAEAEASEFAAAFERYANARFGSLVEQQNGFWAWEFPSGYTEFHLVGRQTFWIMAPESALAQAIRDVVLP
jgi:hypothetical protein